MNSFQINLIVKNIMIIVIFTTTSTITIVITNLLIYIGVEYQLGCYYLLFFNYYYYYYFVLCAYNKFNKVKSYLHVSRVQTTSVL